MTIATIIAIITVASAAVANAAPAPEWRLTVIGNTSVRPNGTEHFMIEARNLGTVATSGSLTVKAVLPPGLVPVGGIPLIWKDQKASPIPCEINGTTRTIECASPFVHNPGDSSRTTFTVKASTEPGPKIVRFQASGGGGQSVEVVKTVNVQTVLAEAGFESFDGLIADANGQQFTQAAGHPYDVGTTFELDTHTDHAQLPPSGLEPGNQDGIPVEPMRDVFVNLPPGLLGNVNAVAKCTVEQLNNSPGFEAYSLCPTNSQVGTITLNWNISIGTESTIRPLFNMVPPIGVPARFGFTFLGIAIYLDASLRYRSDYGITVGSRDISVALPIAGVETHFWGVPTSESHTRERSCPGRTSWDGAGETCPSGAPPIPFIRMPTSCPRQGEGLKWSASTDTWFKPGAYDQLGLPLAGDPNWKSASYETHDPPVYPQVAAGEQGPVRGTEGCDIVPVRGKLSASPSAIEAETPSGLLVHVEVPNPGLDNPEGISSSDIKGVKVTLPVGVTVNPSQAEGLGVCTPAQYASTELSFHPDPSKGCPSDSKIGTVLLHTPLLEEPIEGNVFVAAPRINPFGTLLALYMVLEDPYVGVLVKQAGKVETDPVTGQITTTFDEIPQLPFSDFDFKFREGARAPLVTPATCGTYTTNAVFTPWSTPAHTVESQSQFGIVHGIGGGSCPPGGTPPFAPEVIAGTLNNNAASYTPFTLHISRHDGEQELTKFTTILPPGLTGNLTGIPFCPDATIEAARHRTGQQELESPSCPAASEIGHSLVGAGVGSVLAHTPGKIYLAGPYHGAQLSILSITSAVVGPFDLGTVVIRFALRVNPTTAQVEVDSAGSDAIPHIIDGIVVHVREIRVYMDRPGFIRNPTSCDPLNIVNTITGAGADYTNPQDQNSVNVSTRFQAANCSLLGFKPVFKVSTSGKTSRTNGASLTVKLAYPKAPEGSQANIRSVKVDLPKQLPSRLTTLQKACTDATFNANPAACPAASRVGVAKAITPILPVPLEGPAYFVSHGGAKFPELIVVIQGYGFTIDLHGETFINPSTNITSSTFRTVPDQPVTSFELTLPQGPDSALAAVGNLCKSKLKMPTMFTAQNGTTIKQTTPITTTGCAKTAKKAKTSRHHKHHGRKARKG
ncbi:MAG TPA: hypothetical protein VGY30_05865 [Solirubrobacteraceae bacterium]|jgi:hypothetical protein|nr:hypothetical protein [Solirubrobacteraceae bacterium]